MEPLGWNGVVGQNNGRLEAATEPVGLGLWSANSGKRAKTRVMEKLKSGAGTSRRNGSADPLGANSEIGRKLKQYYDELVSDEVPDRFAQLLSQLEMAEPARKKD